MTNINTEPSFDLGVVMGYLNNDNAAGLAGLVIARKNVQDCGHAIIEHGYTCSWGDAGPDYVFCTDIQRMVLQ